MSTIKTIGYDSKTHNPIIRDLYKRGVGIVNIAASLKITMREMCDWRRAHKELNNLIAQLETDAIAAELLAYRKSLDEDPQPNWRIVKKLQTFYDYHIDHVFVTLPELTKCKDMYARHELLLEYVANRVISIETAERLSKLLKDNAEIYKMDALDKRMQEIEDTVKEIAKQKG